MMNHEKYLVGVSGDDNFAEVYTVKDLWDMVKYLEIDGYSLGDIVVYPVRDRFGVEAEYVERKLKLVKE